MEFKMTDNAKAVEISAITDMLRTFLTSLDGGTGPNHLGKQDGKVSVSEILENLAAQGVKVSAGDLASLKSLFEGSQKEIPIDKLLEHYSDKLRTLDKEGT